VVWEIVKIKLPALHHEVEQLMAQADNTKDPPP
jgi:uncharacterized protein with HEPN domain